jgi:probable HAF family extracellular repeat protein
VVGVMRGAETSAPLFYWEGLMSYWKSFGLALFAAVCLLSETFSSAHAQGIFATEWSGGTATKLASPGDSRALGINDAGVVVGSDVGDFGFETALEWNGGAAIDLGGLPGSEHSIAGGINNAGQVVGLSSDTATEWSGGSIINLGGLPGFTLSAANSINNAGQVVGGSLVGPNNHPTEWSGGSIIDLGLPPGFLSGEAGAINDSGEVVGDVESSLLDGAPRATEWSGGSIINLGRLARVHG